MSADSSTGGCYCGHVRYRITGTLPPGTLCHCHSCQRASGAPVVAWTTVPEAAFALTAGELVEGGASDGVRRGFCPRCGSSVTYRHSARPAEVDVTVVTLDDPAACAPASHIWVADRQPWLHIDDALPQHAGWRTSGDG